MKKDNQLSKTVSCTGSNRKRKLLTSLLTYMCDLNMLHMYFPLYVIITFYIIYYILHRRNNSPIFLEVFTLELQGHLVNIHTDYTDSKRRAFRLCNNNIQV